MRNFLIIFEHLNTITMTTKQKEALNYLTEVYNYKDIQTFTTDVFIIVLHNRGVDSIGKNGGVITHLHRFNNKYYLNGSYAKK